MWKDIEGYNGHCKINEHGCVLSFKVNKIDGYELKKRVSTSGYYSVKLSDGKGNKKNHAIHRLLAKAFIDNPFSKREVNHIDENKLNNELSNLEWVTSKENCNHGTRIERIVRAIDYTSVSEKNSRPILQLNHDGTLLRRWDSIKECMLETGFDNSNIVKCCRNKMKSSYGFKWMYAE